MAGENNRLDGLLPIHELQIEGARVEAATLNFTGVAPNIDLDGNGIPRLNVAVGGEGGGVAGERIVADLAALEALDSAALPDGALAFVTTYRDTWRLVKGPILATVNDEIVEVDEGYWVRQMTPDPRWCAQSIWYVSPGGNNENTGATSETPIASVREFVRRVLPHACTARNASSYEIRVRGDLPDEGDLFLPVGGLNSTPAEGVTVHITGDLGAMVPVTSGDIDTVTTVDPATQTHGAITLGSGDLAGLAGCIAVVRSGPRAGATFVIAEVFSSVSARIGAVGASALDVTPVVLEAGDEIDVYDPFLLADRLVVTGFGTVLVSMLAVGAPGEGDVGHSVRAYGSNLFFGGCRLTDGVNAEASSLVDVVLSQVLAGARAQDHASLNLSGAVVQEASPIARTGGTMVSYSATIEGTVRVEAGGVFRIAEADWAAWADCTTAVDVYPGGRVLASGGAVLWGTDVIGPRIRLRPDGALYTADVADLAIDGSGVEIRIGSSDTTFATAGDVDDHWARVLIV